MSTETERAARAEAVDRYRRHMMRVGTAIDHERAAFVAGATWQAARMPSVADVAAWLWRVDHPDRMDGAPLHAQRYYADKARALLALWGAP